MIGAAGSVYVHPHGMVRLIVYVARMEHVGTAMRLGALLYASREEKVGRERAT